ncbi:hypothetical protein [Methanoculleus chikugoensis]|uniref:hypothetical protein n=1 Tax=Methanoculleus chikugoensis TaxID=118126 RepID=UPI001FB53570|nr:hypothetical protein [Methanoculleus chikugoensis]
MTERGILQYRRESLTGIRCRISPVRVERQIDAAPAMPSSRDGCPPFCPPGAIDTSTPPTFEDGSRLRCGGESVTFPNLYPFAGRHVVTVITPDHGPGRFDVRCLADAISGTAEALARSPGYASINWNHLPSAGASIVHPHLQGIADAEPTRLAELYISGGRCYLADHGRFYWDDLVERERCSERFLFEDEIFWSANPPVPPSASGRCGGEFSRYRRLMNSNRMSNRWPGGVSSGSSTFTGASARTPSTPRSSLMPPRKSRARPPCLLFHHRTVEPEHLLHVRLGVHGAAAPGADHPDAPPRRPRRALPGEKVRFVEYLRVYSYADGSREGTVILALGFACDIDC